MILQNTFYSIQSLESDAERIEARIALNADHRIFEGHFPENPVTPGVVQMEMIKELLTTHFDRSIQLLSMSNCKFLAILNPTVHPEVVVSIQWKSEEGTIKINAQIASDDTSFLKLSAVYA